MSAPRPLLPGGWQMCLGQTTPRCTASSLMPVSKRLPDGKAGATGPPPHRSWAALTEKWLVPVALRSPMLVRTADPEHPRSGVRGGALRAQYLLTRILDRGIANGLASQCEVQERWGDLARLSDLSHPDASHEWLWAVDPHKGKPLEADEFVMSVRLRLGCGGPDDATICGNCGVAMLGTSGEHGLLCAKGESTRGHNCVRDELFHMARSVDTCAETEPEGLLASHPRHRPADVLTSAFHGRLAAVDVGVICPSAAGSGSDCVATMEQRKRDRLAPFRQEMEAEGVEYHPFAVSCWGRTQLLSRCSSRSPSALCAGTVAARSGLC